MAKPVSVIEAKITFKTSQLIGLGTVCSLFSLHRWIEAVQLHSVLLTADRINVTLDSVILFLVLLNLRNIRFRKFMKEPPHVPASAEQHLHLGPQVS